MVEAEVRQIVVGEVEEEGEKGSSVAIFRALLLFHSHGRGIWTVESNGFGLGAE